MVYYLTIAKKKKEKAETALNGILQDRNAAHYLKIKAQSEINGISIDEMLDHLRHQADGEVPLRVPPEIEGPTILRASSDFAAALMDMPFALGGGTIDSISLRNDAGDYCICNTANEYLSARKAGYWPYTQFEITAASMAEQTSQMLRSIKDSRYAKFSSIRLPRISLKSLDRWSSKWVSDCLIEMDRIDIDAYTNIQSLLDAGFLTLNVTSDWEVGFEAKFGLSVRLSELFRADLDGDNWEEILIFAYSYAPHGTLRAGYVFQAKMSENGIFEPIEIGE